MPPFKDLSGSKKERLLVHAHAGILDDLHRWICRCDCGKWLILTSGAVRTQQSCGCLNRENILKVNTIHGHAKDKNETYVYRLWYGIKNRCFTKNTKGYQDYGGRGITMHRAWIYGTGELNGFQCFVKFIEEELGPRPSPLYSFDRMNNDGNYEPGNVRWATKAEQAANTRRNIYVQYEGKQMLISHAMKVSGVTTNKLYGYLKKGMSHQEIFDNWAGKKSIRDRIITLGDESKTLVEWERSTGISRFTISMRLDRLGWTVERTLTAPVQQHKSHRRKPTG